MKEFEKNYNPAEIEDRLYEKWQEKNYSYRFPVKIKEGNSIQKIGR
mgnify:CR=1 FL=1